MPKMLDGMYFYLDLRASQIMSFTTALLVLGIVFTSYAQQFQFQNLSVRDGLGQSQVYCIEEDLHGKVWLGTRGGGVSRFDGRRFDSFTEKDGLPSNYINAIQVDKYNTVWIATDRGVAKSIKSNFSIASDSVNMGMCMSLCTIDDRIYIGTSSGLFEAELPAGKIHKSDILTSETIHVISRVSNEIWFGTDQGIFRWVQDSLIPLSVDSGLNSPLVRSIYQDDEDGVWIGTYGGGLNYWNNGLDNVSDWFPLKETRIHDIISDDESLWFATQTLGLCRFNRKDSTAQFIKTSHGLANNNIRSLFIDSWSNLWIGTSGGGVSKFSGQEFDYYTTENGLSGNYIYALSEDCLGSVWVGTSGSAITQFTDSGVVQLSLPENISTAKSRAILQSSDSALWIALDTKGLAHWTDDTFRIFNAASGLGGNVVRDIIEDPFGRIWLALEDGGITRLAYNSKEALWQMERWTYLQLGSNRIFDLQVDNKNRVWFAGNGCGIGCIVGDTVWNAWNPQDTGLSKNVNAMALDAYGVLWVGTAREGLQSVDLNSGSYKISTYADEGGLASDICYQLTWDASGYLWVGSEKGIQRLRIDASSNPIEFELIGYDEGFLGVETTLNASLFDSMGRLWFGSINGLSRLVGELKSGETTLPKLFLTDIQVNARSFNPEEDSFRMPYDSNSISVQFEAISQVNADDILYQWRLVGLEEWSEPSSNARINYSNLEGGNYRFEVRATLDQVHWTPIETFHISIDEPFWVKPWFLISMGLGFVLVVLLVVSIRLRGVRRRAAAKEAELRVEKELLELEQKALRLQMNPHFIFNALNSIQALISGNDPKTARYFLAKFSKLMRQVLDNSRQTKISLEREIETLNNYLSMEQFCHGDRFTFQINIDEEVDTESLNIPPMLIQPFVENAVIHGVSHLESNGSIELNFKLTQDYLIIQVEDNGIGREQALKIKSQEGQKHKSTALIITQERLSNLNDIADGIKYEDLTDENGGVAGTRVTIKVRVEDDSETIFTT